MNFKNRPGSAGRKTISPFLIDETGLQKETPGTIAAAGNAGNYSG